MRVLLPGGSGFIGSPLGVRLRDLGHEVIVASRSPAADVFIDVRSQTDPELESLLRKVRPDVVVDLVGVGLSGNDTPNSDLLRVNRDWPVRLTEVVSRVKGIEVLHLASSTAIAEFDGRRESPYSESKYLASAILGQKRAEGARVHQIFVHNVYGPDQPHQRFIRFAVTAAADNAPLELRYPNRVRDFILVTDAVDMICTAVEDPPRAHGLHIGTGKGHTLLEVSQLTYELSGSDPSMIQVLDDSTDPFHSTVATNEGFLGTTHVPLETGLRYVIDAEQSRRHG